MIDKDIFVSVKSEHPELLEKAIKEVGFDRVMDILKEAWLPKADDLLKVITREKDLSEVFNRFDIDFDETRDDLISDNDYLRNTTISKIQKVLDEIDAITIDSDRKNIWIP